MSHTAASRVDKDFEKRSANGAYIYAAAWLAIGIGTGLYQQNALFYYSVLIAFALFGAIRLITYAHSAKIRQQSRLLWLGIMYANALFPALLLSCLFSLSLVNEAYQSLYFYLLITIFALLSGGMVNFAPRPDISLSFLLVIIIPPVIAAVFLADDRSLEASMLLIYGVFMFSMSRRLNSEYEQLVSQQIELERLNHLDSLTGIANRRAFDEALELNWTTHVRTEANLSLMLLDIDHFKRINDTFGHSVGDQVIKDVAAAIESVCKRKTDSVARIGGEEFAVLVPVSNPEQVAKLAEDTKERIAAMGVPHAGGKVSFTASIGVATCVPHHNSRPIDLFNLADKCLYRAKQEGRNQVVASAQPSESSAQVQTNLEGYSI